MDREELLRLMNSGPIRVRMNDGESYDIVHSGEAIVSDISAHVLHRDADGKLRAVVLPLVTMSAVIPIDA